MPQSFMETMSRATRLTRAGKLLDATALIRSVFGAGAHAASPAPDAAEPWVIDVEARDITSDGVTDLSPADRAVRLAAASPAFRERVAREYVEPIPLREPEFVHEVFSWAGQDHDYRLYVPGGAATEALPLVVMLHGCRQSSLDFANGTGMNDHAELRRCIVLYPEQNKAANSFRCWNWFNPGDQQRDRGEAAALAALVRHVSQTRAVDTGRIYICGLSAGGAMAAVVGHAYPDLFAAIGIHSGLPDGAVTNAGAALRNMRQGPDAGAMPDPTVRAAVPTIVIHGNEDSTVHPSNGERIVRNAVYAYTHSAHAANDGPEPLAVQVRTIQAGQGERTTTCTQYRNADGIPCVEHWAIENGPHAWSGGLPGASYSDPRGPDASAAMLDFFLRHRL